MHTVKARTCIPYARMNQPKDKPNGYCVTYFKINPVTKTKRRVLDAANCAHCPRAIGIKGYVYEGTIICQYCAKDKSLI